MIIAHLTERFGIYGFQANIFIVITTIKTMVDHFYSSYLFFFFHFLSKKITLAGTKAERLSKRQP